MPESSLSNDEERALSLDIQRLWELGAYDMATLSEVYASSSTELHKSTRSEGSLFTTPGTGRDGTVNTELSQAWVTVRDTLQTLMFNSANNYRDIGEAVVKASEDYANTDDRFAEELSREGDRLKEDEDHGALPQQSAPTSPDDPDYTEPSSPIPSPGGPDLAV